MISCFGGDRSFVKPAQTPLQSIWSFTPDGKGSGDWKEAVDPGSQSIPQGMFRPLLVMAELAVISGDG